MTDARERRNAAFVGVASVHVCSAEKKKPRRVHRRKCWMVLSAKHNVLASVSTAVLDGDRRHRLQFAYQSSGLDGRPERVRNGSVRTFYTLQTHIYGQIDKTLTARSLLHPLPKFTYHDLSDVRRLHDRLGVRQRKWKVYPWHWRKWQHKENLMRAQRCLNLEVMRTPYCTLKFTSKAAQAAYSEDASR